MTPRSETYLAYVRQLPCAVCGANPPSDPHHVETGGVGMKGSDGSVSLKATVVGWLPLPGDLVRRMSR